MNYKTFINQLFEIKNINWAFVLTKEQKNKLKFNSDDEIINNIAFLPIDKEQKKELLNIIIKGNISFNAIKNVFKKKYINFLESYSYNDKRLEEYIEYFYEWIEIITQERVDLNVINRVKKNINTENSLFWFFLIKKVYTLEKYNESYNLIRYVKEEKIINKEDSKYNEIILYEFYSLRRSKKYLYERKWQKKLCGLAKKIKNFETLRITTILECNLLNDEKELFIKNFNKYEFEILNWTISDILNIYELSIYINCNDISNKIANLLELKDIKEYIGSDEYLIYEFLNDIRKYKYLDSHRIKLKNKFDLYHYDWYLAKVNNQII